MANIIIVSVIILIIVLIIRFGKDDLTIGFYELIMMIIGICIMITGILKLILEIIRYW